MRNRERLPPTCADCRPYGGLWREAKDGGLTRCGCARGRRLAELDTAGGHDSIRTRRSSIVVRDWKVEACGEGRVLESEKELNHESKG